MPWRPTGCAGWAKQFCKVHVGWPARKFAGFFVGRDCGPKKKPAPLASLDILSDAAKKVMENRPWLAKQQNEYMRAPIHYAALWGMVRVTSIAGT
ncbi:Os11g0250400 [Oryza sativa Japonica Group]|jgi:hypothetical protein|uniref:Os11g0250400 protein n=1 Tax=Oryza sativa subsp. japonica TaxID=39947 RepID=A0A0P0Y0U7_ORYSJ|nr:hypothetical protein EE612_054504 [Oryza sativa]BAT13444.1 Os11g0250400 [Oryza sativa Japonica Group]